MLTRYRRQALLLQQDEEESDSDTIEINDAEVINVDDISSSDEDVIEVSAPVPVNEFEGLGLDQIRRIQRMREQALFLIDIKKDNDKFEVKVSGSTANLYTVTIDTNAEHSKDLITCNCPDSAMGARFRKCYCKHSAFVLLKACHMVPSFMREGPLSNWSREILKQELHLLDQNRNWGGLTNSQYLEQFKLQQQSSDNPYTIPDNYEMDEECPICCDNQEDRTSSAKCPRCRHCFHKACINQWLLVSTQTCPLCRASWEGYQAKRRGGFVNLVN